MLHTRSNVQSNDKNVRFGTYFSWVWVGLTSSLQCSPVFSFEPFIYHIWKSRHTCSIPITSIQSQNSNFCGKKGIAPSYFLGNGEMVTGNVGEWVMAYHVLCVRSTELPWSDRRERREWARVLNATSASHQQSCLPFWSSAVSPLQCRMTRVEADSNY